MLLLTPLCTSTAVLILTDATGLDLKSTSFKFKILATSITDTLPGCLIIVPGCLVVGVEMSIEPVFRLAIHFYPVLSHANCRLYTHTSLLTRNQNQSVYLSDSRMSEREGKRNKCRWSAHAYLYDAK